MAANSALLCVLIEVLQPLDAELIVGPAVLRDSDNPIVRYRWLLVPGREVVLALKYDKGWDRLALRVDALDDAGPLSVALLCCLWPFSTLRACDNSSCSYNAYYEPRLV